MTSSDLKKIFNESSSPRPACNKRLVAVSVSGVEHVGFLVEVIGREECDYMFFKKLVYAEKQKEHYEAVGFDAIIIPVYRPLSH